VSPDELVARAKQFMPDNNNEEIWTFTPDEEGAVWIDYVADLGDGLTLPMPWPAFWRVKAYLSMTSVATWATSGDGRG